MTLKRETYANRSIKSKHQLAKKLLDLMEKKQTNLCIAADFIHCSQILWLAEVLGPYICVFKTHVDVLIDFTAEFTEKLVQIARKHDFLIFEDRKFADIGNTVQMQYEKGIYYISSWADITNAHPIPGDGIVDGLKAVGKPLGRGLLLLAEMSSSGSLAKGDYTKEAYEMAKRHEDFVFGFIGQQKLEWSYQDTLADFIYMTPGVQLQSKSDGLGQQYRTPKQVIQDCGCDIIIVGRGIYGPLAANDQHPSEETKNEIIKNAEMYRKEGWTAYLSSIN